VVYRDSAIRVRINRLEEVITELEKLQRLGQEALRSSLSQMWAVERGLQLGAEIIFDVGNHILTTRYGVSPADYGDIVKQLARQRVISKALAVRLEGLAGFRNIIVHDYIRLDPEKVLAALAVAPGDFNDFASALRGWLDASA
jgi:uncharacterized protein YutE (UPF0331/DUF86 family)